MALSKLVIVLIAVALVVLIIAGTIIGLYNGFVAMDQSISAKWSEVENQYQRQADLIPNLVSTVSSAVTVETRLINDVTQARSRWQDSATLFDKDKAGVDMANGIANLITAVATSENYPVLQANKQFTTLMDELTGTQNRISVARGRYIDAIRAYNVGVKSFPGNLVAGMFGFAEKEYYQASVSALQTPSLGSGTLPG